MKEYNKYDIKKFWNSPEAKLIQQLDIDDLSKETLQAINKFGNAMLFPNKTAGLPAALAKQLGWQPSYKDVQRALKDLRTKYGYIIHTDTQEIQKPKSKFYKVYYTVNMNRIKDDLSSNENALF